MTMLRLLSAVLLAGAALSACDRVQVPGAPEKPATTDIPPPPPEVPVADTGTTPSTPGPTPTDTPPADPDTPPAPPATPDFSGIGALTEINAVNCAVFSSDTLTVAELMNAAPPEPGVSVASINGTAVALSTFPGIVKLEPEKDLPGGAVSNGHCGATRIAERWFVTAAHCLDSKTDRIEMVVGSAVLSAPTARRIEGVRAICHAAYGGAAERYANDVALIEVSAETAATLGDVPIAAMGPTALPFTPRNYPRAFVGGWGLTNFNAGTLSNELLSAELGVTSVGPALIQTASLNGSGPCIGDSGGPVYVAEADGTRRLVGVLSSVAGNAQGQFCQGDYEARFTNLQGFSGWIGEVMAVCDARPDLCDAP